MENDTAIPGDAKLEERNGHTSEELDLSLRENVHLSLDGSKGSDDEQVFEEVVEARNSKIGPGITIINKEENPELIVTLGNDEVYPDEFHQAVAPPTVMSVEDPVVKSEILISEENYDDKEVVEKIVRGETKGLMDEIIAESNVHDIIDAKEDYKEIVESAPIAGETQNLDYLDDSLEKSEEPKDGLSYNKMTFIEALTSGGTKVPFADNDDELDLC